MKATKRVLTLKHVRGNTFRVINQTHREDDFARSGDTFKAANGVVIQSCSYPEWDGATLFVRGDTLAEDDRKIDIPKFAQTKVLAAVREYNRKAGMAVVPFTAKWADHNVTITKTTLTVGCSTFSIKDFRALVKMVDKATKK